MKDKIIEQTIYSLQTEGLRFSVDALAERLKISKKTVYKYFSTKEELAVAVYEKFYADAERRLNEIADGENTAEKPERLLRLYFHSCRMVGGEIFNKYALNGAIAAFAEQRHHNLWERICPLLGADDETRTILDGAFEKISKTELSPEKYLKKLVKLL